MGQSAKLLLQLNDLINAYLNYICGEDEVTYLVIQIDDADMDINRTFQILEDVRKYLGLPRVIVLIGTNIDQLETTVEQHFLNEYREGLKYPGSIISVEQCHNIAELYLQKAIPHTRRIHLPDLEETIRQSHSSIGVVYKSRHNKDILSNDAAYQKQLLDLIHRKTGMVFTYESDYLHNLLPTHMRELAQFLPFFCNMTDLPLGGLFSNVYEVAVKIFLNQSFQISDGFDTEEFLSVWERNLNRLEFYLVHHWSCVNLRENSCCLFKAFVEKPDSVRNLFLLRSLVEYYLEERSSTVSSPLAASLHDDLQAEFVNACMSRGIDILSYAENSSDGSYCASYANVMGALGALTSLPGGDRQYKFAYAVRLFYSIHLHLALIRELRTIAGGSNIEIDYQTITQLLGGTLLRRGPVNNVNETSFGCWVLEIPVQWIDKNISSGEIDNKLQHYQFLRRKFKKDSDVRSIRIPELDRLPEFWREIDIPFGQVDKDVVLFSPLYPLLAALDSFIQFKDVNELNINSKLASQIYYALIICLNWDVQRILFKRIRNQKKQKVTEMYRELLTMIVPETVGSLNLDKIDWLDSKCYDSGLPNEEKDKSGETDNYIKLLHIILIHTQPELEFSEYRNGFESCINAINSYIKVLPSKVTDIWFETIEGLNSLLAPGSRYSEDQEISEMVKDYICNLKEALHFYPEYVGEGLAVSLKDSKDFDKFSKCVNILSAVHDGSSTCNLSDINAAVKDYRTYLNEYLSNMHSEWESRIRKDEIHQVNGPTDSDSSADILDANVHVLNDTFKEFVSALNRLSDALFLAVSQNHGNQSPV